MAFSFPFRFKFGFLCCFLCANKATMVVLFVFELYIYLRYMHVTMAAKCKAGHKDVNSLTVTVDS
jgi:hypothetical protein